VVLDAPPGSVNEVATLIRQKPTFSPTAGVPSLRVATAPGLPPTLARSLYSA
jgi:hypothetical protein